MGEHILIVTADATGLDKLDPEERAAYLADPDLDYRVECPGVTDGCRSWEPCGCGLDRAEDETCPRSGLEHICFAEFGLGTPTRACFVATNDWLSDAASDLGLPPGEYPVTFDVEDEVYLRLYLVTEAVPRG